MKHFNVWFMAVILASIMAVGAQTPPPAVPPVMKWTPADGATVHQKAGMVAVQMAVSDAAGLQSTTLSCTSNDGSSSSVSSFYPGYKAAIVTLHVHVLIFPKMMAFPVPFDGATGGSALLSGYWGCNSNQRPASRSRQRASPGPACSATGGSLFTVPDMNSITIAGTATGIDKQKTAQSITIHVVK